MKRFIWTTLICILFASATQAQQGYDWGENKPAAQGNWLFLNNHVKAGMYEEAKPKLSWLLANAPNLHEDLYKQATKIYEAVEKEEKDPELKEVYQDSALFLYDERVKRFGGEANVLNRKGKVAFKYEYDDPTKLGELYNLYAKIFELNGQKTYASHAYYYMYLASMKLKKEEITEDQMLDLYFFLNDFLDGQAQVQAANPKKLKIIEKSRTQVSSVLEKSVTMDCEKIATIFEEKFNASPEDLGLAKKIYRLCVKAECFSDMTMKAVELIAEKEPSIGTSMSLAPLYVKRKDFDKAMGEYERALGLTTDPETKAEIHLAQAQLSKNRGQKTTARTYARKAIATGKKTATAYEFIGDLYYYSFNDCKSDDVLATRSIYIAAYDMYKKAGNAKKMAEAQKNFPSGEEIFVRDMAVGDNMSTGCWIGETVKLQKR